jgi:tetrahydromethanopterin S-methyltransferase subunit F
VKRLTIDQEVTLSVGDATVDCRVAVLNRGEAALEPLVAGESSALPAASAGASLVFTHEGRLVMLRGAMYRATGENDLRFAEKTVASAKAQSAEQRRKAARLPITLPATLRQLDADGAPIGEDRQLITRDISIGGFAVSTGVVGLAVGVRVSFQLVLTNGAILAGTARVVRSASEMAGLTFEQLPPADRVRLAGFLASQQTSRAAVRPAGAPAASAASAAAMR